MSDVRAVAAGLAAVAADGTLAVGQVAYLDTDEGIAMSPEAAVVGLAVVLCIVGAAAAGDVASAGLLGGGFGHLYPL
ncbi:MAG: hypothetical protein OXC09_10395 [Truepera sp.]|nr:hypothetical protein [Truepera sp.]